MIIAWIGNRGQGKTYRMTKHVLRSLSEGWNCWVNFEIRLPAWFLLKHGADVRLKLHTWQNLSDILELRHVHVYADEIQHLMNSRQFKNLPAPMMYKLCESRKDNFHMYGTLQRLQRLDVVMRELVDDCIVVSKWWTPFGYIFHERHWEQLEVDPNATTIWEREGWTAMFAGWFVLEKRIARAYNTLERVTAKRKEVRDSLGTPPEAPAPKKWTAILFSKFWLEF